MTMHEYIVKYELNGLVHVTSNPDWLQHNELELLMTYLAWKRDTARVFGYIDILVFAYKFSFFFN
jgi:hypothetical protein